jgi:hypothetical protein
LQSSRRVELDGGQPIESERTIPTEERIEACLAGLVEVAWIKTLDELGDGPAALDRTRLWLSTKQVGS